MNELSETEKAYIAGFVDGEGCINIGRFHPKHGRNLNYNLKVGITQKSLDPLDWIKEKTGAGGLCVDRRGGVHHLTYVSRQAAELLRAILPYLIHKRAEAIVGIEFQAIQSSRKCHGRLGHTPQTLAEQERYWQKLQDMKIVQRRPDGSVGRPLSSPRWHRA